MNNFIIFAVGLVVTLITAMGVITGTVFMGYKKSYHHKETDKYDYYKIGT